MVRSASPQGKGCPSRPDIEIAVKSDGTVIVDTSIPAIISISPQPNESDEQPAFGPDDPPALPARITITLTKGE